MRRVRGCGCGDNSSKIFPFVYGRVEPQSARFLAFHQAENRITNADHVLFRWHLRDDEVYDCTSRLFVFHRISGSGFIISLVGYPFARARGSNGTLNQMITLPRFNYYTEMSRVTRTYAISRTSRTNEFIFRINDTY